MITRIGGFCAIMVRICTGEVCVRSSMREPSAFGAEIERVVHLARRMAFGEVELGEVEIVGLDVRPFGDREAHVGEDRRELVDHLADRMDAARPRPVSRAPAGSRRPSRWRAAHRARPRRARSRRAVSAVGDALLQAVDQRALLLALAPASCAPSVFSSAETEPLLPSAATRTASSAASSVAAAIGRKDLRLQCLHVAHRVTPEAAASRCRAACRPPVSACSAPGRDGASGD